MNILFVRVSSIGDVIHTLPALFYIKACIPDAHISWVVQKKAAALLKHQPILKNVWVIHDRYLSPSNLSSTFKSIRDIRSHRWDAIIDFQGLAKTSTLIMMLRGKKFGFDRTHAREFVSTWFTHHHTQPIYKNIIQKNLALASDVVSSLTHQLDCPSIESIRNTFMLSVPDRTKKLIDEWIEERAIKKIIALCPNTTWQSKRWPIACWENLIEKNSHSFPDYSIVLLGKEFGADAAALASFVQEKKLKVHMLPPYDLAATSYFLSKVSVLIAPDTSFLHLADFLSIPAIGLFGPTHALKHGPFLSEKNKRLALQADCPHEYQRHHANGQDCMLLITPDMVLKKLGTL